METIKVLIFTGDEGFRHELTRALIDRGMLVDTARTVPEALGKLGIPMPTKRD